MLREARQPVPPELLAFGTTVKKKESKVCVQRLCQPAVRRILYKWVHSCA